MRERKRGAKKRNESRREKMEKIEDLDKGEGEAERMKEERKIKNEKRKRRGKMRMSE
jgi:hypothetical protein